VLLHPSATIESSPVPQGDLSVRQEFDRVSRWSSEPGVLSHSELQRCLWLHSPAAHSSYSPRFRLNEVCHCAGGREPITYEPGKVMEAQRRVDENLPPRGRRSIRNGGLWVHKHEQAARTRFVRGIKENDKWRTCPNLSGKTATNPTTDFFPITHWRLTHGQPGGWAPRLQDSTDVHQPEGYEATTVTQATVCC
jgi:hypothetical protein